MNKRAITYARVSGNDANMTGGKNLQGQIELCRKHALENGYTIIAEFAEDDHGASGADWDLPQLNQALEMARNGDYDVFIVREVDRLARNLAKQMIVEHELKKHGVSIEYALYDFPDTPEGHLQKHMYAMFAEYERSKIAQRLRRGVKRVLQEGHIGCGGPALLGYKRVQTASYVELEIDEENALTIQHIFDLFANKKMSICEITEHLNDGGFQTSTGSKWYRRTVRRILVNPAYIGNYSQNGYPIEIPAIVDADVFQRTQERLSKRGTRSDRKRELNLLTGRAFCDVCNKRMRDTFTSHAYYVCRDHCTRNHNAEKIDAKVWQWVSTLLTDEQFLYTIYTRLQDKRETETDPLHEKLEATQAQIDRQQKRLNKILNLLIDCEADETDEEYKFLLVQKNEVKNLLQSLTAILEELQEKIATIEQQERVFVSFMEYVKRIKTQVNLIEADNEFRQRAMNALRVKAFFGQSDSGRRYMRLECKITATVIYLDGDDSALSFELDELLQENISHKGQTKFRLPRPT